MEITFVLPPHLFFSTTSPRESAEALRPLLDALTDVNVSYLRHHASPPLYGAGVVYARTDDWESIPALYAYGYHGTDKPDSHHPKRLGKFGDCKSLTCALVAEYRIQGKQAEPAFRFAQLPDGSLMYHILVRTMTGYEDPSRALGMGQDEYAPFYRQGAYLEF